MKEFVRVHDAERYTRNLRTCLERFGFDPQSDRFKTATTVLVLVEQISSGSDIVKILAEATVATTEAAMKDCLSKASLLADTLEQTTWEIFESIADLADERKPVADKIRRTVEEALCSDEYVVPLSSIKTAQIRALRLLTTTTPPVPLDSTLPPKPLPSGRRVVSQGTKENLEINTAQRLLSELTQNLKAEQTIRLSISWIIDQGSTSDDF